VRGERELEIETHEELPLRGDSVVRNRVLRLGEEIDGRPTRKLPHLAAAETERDVRMLICHERAEESPRLRRDGGRRGARLPLAGSGAVVGGERPVEPAGDARPGRAGGQRAGPGSRLRHSPDRACRPTRRTVRRGTSRREGRNRRDREWRDRLRGRLRRSGILPPARWAMAPGRSPEWT